MIGVLNKIFANLNMQWILLLSISLFLLFSYVFKKNITKKQFIVIGLLILVTLIMLGFRLLPPESFDLYRHYDDMNLYRRLNFISSMEAMFSRPNFLWYFIIEILSLFNDNRILLLFTLIITIESFFFIIYKLKSKFYLNNYQLINCIFVFFSIINLSHLLSGLRNSLAIALFSLGLYYLVFEKNKRGFLLFICAFFIHPMTIILILFYFLLRIFEKIKFIEPLLLFWTIFSNGILLILSIIPLKLFELFFTKFQLEMSGVFGIDYRIFILEIIQIILFLFLVKKIYVAYSKYNLKENKNNFQLLNEKKIIFYFYIILLFIVGSIPMTNIFIRTRFIIAYFIPLIFILKNKYLGFDKKYEHLLLIISFVINIYYVYYMMCNGIYI